VDKHQLRVNREVGEKVDNTRQIAQLTRMIGLSDSGYPKVTRRIVIVEARDKVDCAVNQNDRPGPE